MTLETPPDTPSAEASKQSEVFEIGNGYAWLRKWDDPAVQTYLSRENDRVAAFVHDVRPLFDGLYKAYSQLEVEPNVTRPFLIGDFYYSFVKEEGAQYGSFQRCRKGSDQYKTILDLDELASESSYFRLGALRVSPSQRYLAYSFDSTGTERYTLFFRDLERERPLLISIADTSLGLEWGVSDDVVYYLKLNEHTRPYAIFCHYLGESCDDVCLFEERDENIVLELSKSRDQALLFATSVSASSTEVRYLKLNQANGQFKVFRSRRQNLRYWLEHHNERFLILTNEDAPDFRVMQGAFNQNSRSWKEVFPSRVGTSIHRIDVFKTYLAISGYENGLGRIWIHSFEDSTTKTVTFHEDCYACWLAEIPEYEAQHLYLNYTSLATPQSLCKLDIQSLEVERIAQQSAPTSYNPGNFVSKRLNVPSELGKGIPISIVHRRDLLFNEPHPMYLHVYGSYGANLEPTFDAFRIPFLECGGIVAVAHVRGGGELGSGWHSAGRLLDKTNTVKDLITCIEFLVQEGYTTKNRLAVCGESAGGFVVGTLINQRPELVRSVVAKRPFMDILTTMLDPDLPQTTLEYEEWGNPREPLYFNSIKSYSPFENIVPQPYPHILVFASGNDMRVPHWNATKWVAKLRDSKTNENLLLLSTALHAGHGGPSDQRGILHERALEYSFLFHTLARTAPTLETL